MAVLTREACLAPKLPFIDVPVPEMGPGAVLRVQQMSVNTRAEYLERCRQADIDLFAYEDDQAKPEDERANLAKPADFDKALYGIIRSAVDADGNALFGEADMPTFEQWSMTAVTRVWETINELNDYNRSYTSLVDEEKKG